MLIYPKIDPVAFSAGPIKVHWYGLMYLLSFLWFLYGGKFAIEKKGHAVLTKNMIEDFLFYGALGTIIGGRLGYCLLYQPGYYLSNPLDIFKTWDGGMSFHGGMLGVLFAIYLFAKKIKTHFFVVADFIAPFIPVCLFLGRLGNFINGELFGRLCKTNLPWCMVFPQSGVLLPRHPSQLYEALIEGILLTLILWFYSAKPRKTGQISGLFLISYGIARFILEFFREPDSFAVSIVQFTGISLGQIYSLPMIIGGIMICVWAKRNFKKGHHNG